LYALDENGVLTISGTGDIPTSFIGVISSNNNDFMNAQHLVIEIGITSIGIAAFINVSRPYIRLFPQYITQD